jgi:SAM-dependent methyltransferase
MGGAEAETAVEKQTTAPRRASVNVRIIDDCKRIAMTTERRHARIVVSVALTLVCVGWSQARAQNSRSAPVNADIYAALNVKQGSTVGEIGAGSGELSIEVAKLVGAEGKVFTSELGDERVKALERAVRASALAQITVVAGEPNKTNFPDGCCDAIFMRNVYHHFADPAAMTRSIAASLKPGGRVAVIDFTPNRGRPEAARPADRANDDSHGVSADSVARELKEAGLELVKTEPGNDRWFMVVAAKR